MLKKFIQYYKPHKKIFFLDMLASFLISLIGILYPIVTRKVYSKYVPEGRINAIIILGVILLILYVIRMLLRFFVQYYGHVMGVKIQAKMRKDLFHHLERLPYSFYDEHETGKIMIRMTDDLQDVSELAHHGPENFFICGVMIIGTFIYLLTINWILTLIIFACVPLLVFISLFMRKRMREEFTKTRQGIASINASLESSISGIRLTKAFTQSKIEEEKFDENNALYVKSRSKAYKAMGQFQSSTSFVVDLFNVVCVVGGGIIAIKTNFLSESDYLAFVISISLFITPLTTLINFVEQYQNGVTGFKRFLEIMEVPVEEDEEGALDSLNLTGDIEFKNVNFNYTKKENILKDISFKINKGDTIALVGESGGGKTTICHLLLNFYPLTSGDIVYDGISINHIKKDCLRNNIGIVQQDVFIFKGTIKENILYGKEDSTDEELIDACKRSNIYSFIQSLPNGFETEVGERGVKLSGGQKQRIAIARVFLKNPPILILDEATSALDNTTELMIQKSLYELSKGRTTIIVAHRLSTIKSANKIIVINHGEIIEQGSHEELIEKNGAYKELYSLQFKKQLD